MTRIHDTWADSDTPLTLELYHSGGWQDITDYLSEDGWEIDRTARPATFACTLDNTGGPFSPRNPNSSLFGLIGRNTPIRASITLNSVTYVRFVGEVSEWPQRWTTKGTSYAPISAAGITRRIGQGSRALAAPYTRACASTVAPIDDLVAWWPLTDPDGATKLSSGLPGGYPMRIFGSPTLAGDADSFVCSEPGLRATSDFKAGGVVAGYTDTGEWQAMILVAFPSGGVTATTRIFSVYTSSADVQAWHLSVDTSGNLYLDIYDQLGNSVYASGAAPFAVNGLALRLYLSAAQNGADVDFTVATLAPGSATGGYVSDTATSVTNGRPGWFALAPDAGLAGCTLVQATVQSAVGSVFALWAPLAAHDGEEAHDRIDRLATEEGYTADITGTYSAPLGPQQTGTLLDLLDDAADSDLGRLAEPRDAATLGYRTLESACGQAPGAEIAYTDNLLLPFEPVEDDAATRNRVTITRRGGTSATVEDTTSVMSTQDPPAGVGLYEESLTLSLEDDDQVLDQASWRVHAGTIDQARWPRIGVQLAHPTFVADTALTADVLGLDIGDRLVVTDPPSWLPPGDVDQLVQGYTERVTPSRYLITFACTPYEVTRVPLYNDAGADPDDIRYSGAGTALSAALGSTQATFTGSECMSVAGDNVATDLEVIVQFSITAWPPASQQTLVAKYVNSGNQRTWSLDIDTSGNAHMYLSDDGATYSNATSTAGPGWAADETHYLKASFREDDGGAWSVTYSTSDDGGTWTQLGAKITGGATLALYESSALYQLGARSGTSVTGGMSGVIRRVQVLDGIAGTDVVPTEPQDWTDGYTGSGTGTTVADQSTSYAGITAPTGTTWAHDDGDYTIGVGGEEATVTDIDGTAPTYVLTLSRAANGVLKTHEAGAELDVVPVGYYGL